MGLDWLERLIPSVGERIHRYELVELIGRGGFGVVYRARQEGLEEDVALKLLLPEHSSDLRRLKDLQARFEQEAKLSKAIKHPAAIKVRDYGQTPDGLPFIVSELVEGRDLHTLIYEEQLTTARIVHIAAQILGCLAEAHHRGIVHRDLKPGNIKVRDIYGEPDSVKVLDFGIAKVSSNLGGVRTHTGSSYGTPHYMSPEQCRGVRDLDGRADLYALGLILAECVGRRRVVTREDTMGAIYTQARPDPHEFSPAVMRSPLFPVIQRATQKEREDRYPDALAMRADLPGVSQSLSEVLEAVESEVEPPTPVVRITAKETAPELSAHVPAESAPSVSPAEKRAQRPALPVLLAGGLAAAVGLALLMTRGEEPEGSPAAAATIEPSGPSVRTGVDWPHLGPDRQAELAFAEPTGVEGVPQSQAEPEVSPLDTAAALQLADWGHRIGDRLSWSSEPFEADALKETHVRIDGRPATARVTRGSAVVCDALPCEIVFARAEGTAVLEVSARGHEAAELPIDTAVDGVYEVRLSRVRRPAAATPTESAPSLQTTPAFPEVPLFDGQ